MSAIQEAARFTRDLQALLAMGLTVPEALERIRRQAPPRWAATLAKAENATRSGSKLSEALRSAGDFPALLIDGLTIDEEVASLDRLAALLEEAEARQRQIRLALAYPVVLLGAGLFLVWLVYGFLGHNFLDLFATMSLRLPLITQVIMAVTRVVSNPLFVTLEIAIIAAFYAVMAGWGGTARWRLALPFFGPWIRRSEAVIWLSWLDHMVELGQPLPQAMRQAARACGDQAFEAGVEEAAQDVERGQRLGAAVTRARLLPHLAQWLLSRGELREFPAGYFEGVATALRRELDLESERGLAWLEIFGVCVMMLIIPPVIFGIFLPMYQLIGNL